MLLTIWLQQVAAVVEAQQGVVVVAQEDCYRHLL
jgi:hypothetical protein